ncbi:MAG TPA: anthrone oxygenase family protein [Mycobacterium sp.]
MRISPFAILASITVSVSAAAGGMMYVFSTFVMQGLNRTGAVNAITAMRGINVEANASAPFLLPHLGAALLSFAVGVIALVQRRRPGRRWILVGAVFGVLAAIITMAFNVPLNDHLDGVDPQGLSAADAAREWLAYYQPWTAWNHVRAVTAFVAAALMLFGLLRDRADQA